MSDTPIELDHHELAQEYMRLRASNAELVAALERCETVLGNMALDNEGAIFNRWPIGHEPLRADAKVVVQIARAAIEKAKQP